MNFLIPRSSPKKFISWMPCASRLVIAVTTAVIFSCTADAQSFKYSDFSATSLTANPLQINGNAAAPATGVSSSAVLRLTSATENQAGSAFNLNPVQLGSQSSFSTAFAFQLSAGGGPLSDGNQPPAPAGADGIVFVLNITTNTVGIQGEGVGYENIGNSVGIKFDTWQDGVANGFPQDSDPTGNFVAVYTNGVTQTAGYLLYSSSNSNTALQYYVPPTYLKNGDVWYAWIDYNGTNHQIDVRLSDGVNVRPTNPQLSQIIDLSSSNILGAAPRVFAGFTSGTGSQWNTQDILYWQFNTNFAPIDVPKLSIASRTNGTFVSWPSSLTVFHLQYNTILTTTNWSAPAEAVQDDGTNKYIVVNPPQGNRYYRLAYP